MKGKDFYKIRQLQENAREEVVLAMRRRVGVFKWYVTGNSKSEHLGCLFIEGYEGNYYFVKDKHYGCKDDYYYCFFPVPVQLVYQNSHLSSNCIFFNDRFKCWFVYDEVKNEFVTFEALDTDTQIAFLEMLDNFVDDKYWLPQF